MITIKMSESSCLDDSRNRHSHFHDEDSRYQSNTDPQDEENSLPVESSITPAGSAIGNEAQVAPAAQHGQISSDEKQDFVFRRIIRNFTPSYVKTSA